MNARVRLGNMPDVRSVFLSCSGGICLEALPNLVADLVVFPEAQGHVENAPLCDL